jgi:iron complex transport system permease protein
MAADAHESRVLARARPSARASPRSLVLLAVLAAAVFCASLLVGSSGTGLRGSLAALVGSGDEATRTVLLAVRLPRVLAAFGVGSLLALAGVLLQALFRNPLADP